MTKKILIDNIEFRSIVTHSNRSYEIISYLISLSENNAKTISEIYSELNKGKGYSDTSFGRHSVLRTINSLKKYEPEKIKSKEVNGKAYFWITINNSKVKHTPEKLLERNSKELLDEISQEKVLEKDLYPDVEDWLNSFPIDGIDFRYTTLAGGFIGRSKYSNPDIIGTNIQGKIDLVVSVEVKNKINNESELTGFAQCCSYKVFSDYVFLFCFKPNSNERLSRLINMCQFHGIGLKFLDEEKLTVPADKNNKKIGDPILRNNILEVLKSKQG